MFDQNRTASKASLTKNGAKNETSYGQKHLTDMARNNNKYGWTQLNNMARNTQEYDQKR